MTSPEEDPLAPLRYSVYSLIIALAVGTMLGRILAVDSVETLAIGRALQKQGVKGWPRSRPFLSANDRSRWLTVRSLVEQGTYEIDDMVRRPGWETIDMVQHKGPDGKLHLYSSKPPLLATLLAGPYWLIYHTTGATLETHPYEICRAMLVLVNLVPFVFYLVLLARLAERWAATPWARFYMLAGAALGTFLTTFAVTINNHLPAATAALFAIYPAAQIWYDGRREWYRFAAAGLAAAFTVACELPALAMFAALTAGLLWRAPRLTLLAYVPAAALVVAAALGTNYLAHGSLAPPYAHRGGNGSGENWYDYSYENNGKTIESYWRHPAGIDRGDPSPGGYALHATLGHHGVFSLTPIWLLSLVGLGIWIWNGERRAFAVLVAGVSIVCLVFYLVQPQMNRNYGGMTSGLRWMFWFTPLWLIALLPTADALAPTRLRRGLGLVLLVLSAMSASYPTWNPWTHPWLTNFLVYLDLLHF